MCHRASAPFSFASFLFVSMLCVGLGAVSASIATEAGARLEADPRDPSLVTLTVQVPGVSWADAGGAFVPQIEGYGSIGESGRPDLPARRVRVARPPGGRLAVLNVNVDWRTGRLPGPVAAWPAWDPSRPELDPELDVIWPAQPVVVAVADGAFRQVHFSSLEIRPVQVDVAAGTFRVARTIRVTLRREEGPSVSSISSPAFRDPMTEAFAGDLALGVDAVGRAAMSSPRASTLADDPPTYPAWKLLVNEDGLYRISYEWAQANAPELLDFLTSNDPRNVAVVCQGVDVPALVEGESDGSFDPGDAIVFFGQAVGDVDPFDATVWEQGDFTDVNVYRLEITGSPARVSTESRAPLSGFPVPPSFPESVHYEENVKFLGFLPANGLDHMYVDPFLNAVDTPDELDQLVPTPGHAGGDVSLRSRMLGFDYVDNYHRTELYVDAVIRDQADWDGFAEFTQGVDQGPVTFDPGAPLDATTLVTVRLPLTRSVSGQPITRDTVAVNWIEIDYDRLYEADSDRLVFSAEDENLELRLGSFSSAPEIWEVSSTTLSSAGMEIAIPTRAIDATAVSGRWAIEQSSSGGTDARRYAAAAGNGFLTPASVVEDTPPSAYDSSLGDSLKSAGLGADWLLIGHDEFLDTSPGSALDELIARRESQGLSTAVVTVEDIYDEFSAGLSDPQGLRDFLSYALQNWSPAPTYVVLLGDASRDYKNDYQYDPPRNFVPTSMWDITQNTQFGYYPSDTWFAAVLGDDSIPDAAIGRLPVHSLAEAESTIRKIIDHETASTDPSWAGRACLVSENDPDDGAELKRVHEEIYDRWFNDPGEPQTAEKVFEPDGTCQDAADQGNADIDACINAGAALVTFAGHGGYRSWGRGCPMFVTETSGNDDLVDISTSAPTFFTVQANCITGHFSQDSSWNSTSDNWYTHLEDFVVTPDKAAFSGIAPAHLTYNFQLDSILDPVYEEIFGRNKERSIAALDMRLRSDFDLRGDTVMVRSLILQADPASTLSIPAPGAPEILSIDQAGSGELDVSWTSVADASTYRLYRANFPGGDYTLAGETSGTSFLDSGLTNCRDYYYYVVSVDSDGFESRWSNFNDTCVGGSPDPDDCKTGTPENPDAPAAPTLLSVTDTERGGQVEVHWDNTGREPDVIRYRVSWGTTSGGPYPSEETTSETVDTLLVSGLENGTEYFFVVQAEHCSLSSAVSNEIAETPNLVRGIDPPKAVGDLMIYRDVDPGDGTADLRLEWTPPTQTVWDKESTVTGTEVHGSDTHPGFLLSSGSLLAELGASASSWIHENKGEVAEPVWYYLVVNIDADGQRSAAGVELPAPVDDLRVEHLTATSELRLTWSAIHEAMTGERMTITGYNVHGRDGTLERTQCGPANLLVEGVPQSRDEVTVDLPRPADTYYTYQVLAVDAHGTEAVW